MSPVLGAADRKQAALHEVGIVGAGPAGLSAALLLGRCGRDVVMFDSNRPRNGASQALHGFLTRDGTPPFELRELGRAELHAYPSIKFFPETEVRSIRKFPDRFEITTGPETIASRVLLLATGRVDRLPAKPGFREFYGRGVYHCPYCDGWERHGQRIVVYGNSPDAVDLSIDLLTWSSKITLCTDGPAEISPGRRSELERLQIPLVEKPLSHLRGESGERVAVVFADGTDADCEAVFFASVCEQRAPFAEELGCDLDQTGSVLCNQHAATNVPGLFIAGNVRGGIHLAIVAAAEGAEAAIAINNHLHDIELNRALKTSRPAV